MGLSYDTGTIDVWTNLVSDDAGKGGVLKY